MASAALTPVLAAGFAALAQLAFDHGWIVTVTPALSALAVGTVAMVVISHLIETLERLRVTHHNELLETLVRARTEEVRETQLDVIRRLSQLAESRDDETGRHIERIGSLAHALAFELGLPPDEAELIGHAASLHDVGKVGVPDHILLKPGRLTAEEFAVMTTHTTIGANVLSGSKSHLLQVAEAIARSHHERWDGTGYPDGLAGEQIPLAARITSVCDVFDALISKRVYKDAWPVDAALAELERCAGTQFDPRLVSAFLRVAQLDAPTAYPSAA